MPLVRSMSLALGCIGLRGRLCLVAAALLVAQGVTTIAVSRLAHGDASLCRGASAETAARGAAAGVCDQNSPATDDSSLCWFDAVLEDDSDGPTAPTWWDLLLCESAQ